MRLPTGLADAAGLVSGRDGAGAVGAACGGAIERATGAPVIAFAGRGDVDDRIRGLLARLGLRVGLAGGLLVGLLRGLSGSVGLRRGGSLTDDNRLRSRRGDDGAADEYRGHKQNNETDGERVFSEHEFTSGAAWGLALMI